MWPDLTIEEFTMVDGDRIGALTPNQLNRLQPQALPTPATMLDPAPSEPIPSDES